VGSSGKNIPISPSPKKKVPETTKIYLVNLYEKVATYLDLPSMLFFIYNKYYLKKIDVLQNL